MKIQPRKNNIDDKARAQEIERLKIVKGEIPSTEERVEALDTVTGALLGGGEAKELTAAKQLNHALRLFGNTLPESTALEIAAIFPEWELGKKYKPQAYVRYGLNQDNEPQIYRVLQQHVSQPDWAPDVAVSLFKKVGFTETGTPLWIQPMGAEDAYMKGDLVVHNGLTYTSSIDNNVWEPGVYGWSVNKPDTNTTVKK